MSDLQHIDDVFADLNQLDSLPSNTGFDAENLWKNLDEKLNPRPQKSTFAWVWVAAIAVFLLGFYVFIPTNTKTNPTIVAKKSIEILENNNKFLAISIPNKAKNNKQKNSKITENQGDTKKIEPLVSSSTPIVEIPKNETVLLVVQETLAVLPIEEKPLLVNPLPISQQALTFNKTKPKLRIVHANQLETSNQNTVAQETQKTQNYPFIVFAIPQKISSSQDHQNSFPLITTLGIQRQN